MVWSTVLSRSGCYFSHTLCTQGLETGQDSLLLLAISRAFPSIFSLKRANPVPLKHTVFRIMPPAVAPYFSLLHGVTSPPLPPPWRCGLLPHCLSHHRDSCFVLRSITICGEHWFPGSLTSSFPVVLPITCLQPPTQSLVVASNCIISEIIFLSLPHPSHHLLPFQLNSLVLTLEWIPYSSGTSMNSLHSFLPSLPTLDFGTHHCHHWLVFTLSYTFWKILTLVKPQLCCLHAGTQQLTMAGTKHAHNHADWIHTTFMAMDLNWAFRCGWQSSSVHSQFTLWLSHTSSSLWNLQYLLYFHIQLLALYYHWGHKNHQKGISFYFLCQTKWSPLGGCTVSPHMYQLPACFSLGRALLL